MERILIIDDEESIRRSLEGILGDEGYQTRIAADGDAALALLAREPSADLVLLDIAMPGRDGISVLAELRERWPQLPVVMMSGHGTIDTAVRSTRLGAFDFRTAARQVLLHDRLQIVDVVEEHLFDVADRCFDVARHRDIDHEEWISPVATGDRFDLRARDDRALRSGLRDMRLEREGEAQSRQDPEMSAPHRVVPILLQQGQYYGTAEPAATSPEVLQP